MAKRVRYEVLPVAFNERSNGMHWKVTRGRERLALYRTQAEAVAAGVALGRLAWAEGRPAELIIKGRNGRIRDSRTYGRDPRHIPG